MVAESATSASTADRLVTSDFNARSDLQMTSPSVGVSVIVPTYNERENIGSIISECLKALPSPRFDVEILVVDDDSADYTWQYPQRLFGDDPRVRVIRRQTRDKGLAQSVSDGFEAARHDYCAVIDADLQHPPEKLAELFTALDRGADIAIGSRHIAGGGIKNWPFWRKVVSKGATTCARAALPDARSTSDPMSGFFAVRSHVVEDVNLDPSGYKILLEVLGKGTYETVAEVPYVFRERERGESKLTAVEYRNFLEHLLQLAVVSRGLDSILEPLRAVRATKFAIIGAIGAVVNMIVFAALVLQSSVFFLLAGIIAFVVAVNWNFVGNWLFTFGRPRERVARQYMRFNLVSITGFLAYSAVLVTTVEFGVPVLLANGVAILSGAVINFFGSDTLVFPQEAFADSPVEEPAEIPVESPEKIAESFRGWLR